MNYEDLKSTVLSQFANSPVLTELIKDMNDYLDPMVNLNDFYNRIWDINTASGYGLDVWGRIVGVGRGITILGVPTTLPDSSFRTLILIKALANITDCSIPSFNQLLTRMFSSEGKCYVTDPGGMGMGFTFEFTLSATDIAILTQSHIFPHPAGVDAYIASFNRATTFGFAGSNLRPFNQGTFFNGVTHVS